MLWVPIGKALLVQLALLVLPLPLSATAVQPLSEPPLAVKCTVPPGLLPVTVAVKAMLAPTSAGLDELAKSVVVLATPDALVITCDNGALAEVALPASPL
jgi:hypothetical protein